MLLRDFLKEMPQLKTQELPARGHKPFYSESTLAERYNILNDNNDYTVVIRKNLDSAAIGVMGIREVDSTPGLEILGLVGFKQHLNLSGIKDTPIKLPKTLQVDLVDVLTKWQRSGWGIRLYFELARAGYTVISDNTQYLGGQAIWKKIAAQSLPNGFTVHIVDHGEIRRTAGLPVVYDGSNLEDSELWSENADKKYTLFALTAK